MNKEKKPMDDNSVKAKSNQRLMAVQHNTIRRLQAEAVRLNEELEKKDGVIADQKVKEKGDTDLIEHLYSEINKLDQARNDVVHRYYKYHKLYITWRRRYLRLLVKTVNQEATHEYKG
jgi:hypothetical protein